MLVVIGIIGVVSALTLPNLNNSTADQEKVAKFLKVHQNLNEALARATVAYGPFRKNGVSYLWLRDIDNSNQNLHKTRFAKRMTKFLKVQKDCGIGDSGCFKSGNFLLLGGSDSEQTFAALLIRSKQGNGTWASSWILKYGNMDYKKVNSSGKCSNGTTPTESNPRCK